MKDRTERDPCSRALVRRTGALLSITLVATASLAADKHPRVCGSFVGSDAIALQLHERHQASLASSTAPRSTRIDRMGNLALIEADNRLVIPANVVDLKGVSLRFSPVGEGSSYTISRESSPVDLTLGRPFNFGDDDTRNLALDFPFSFYGRMRERVFVNSNGNLTFGESDLSGFSSTSDMLEAPPRIAAFFTDLDPSAGGTVRVANQADRLVVTWESVPEWKKKKNENTFQAELRTSGDIILRYVDRLDAPAAVVGITPGVRAGARFVDLDKTTTTGSGALFERFFPDPVVDSVATLQRFYEEFSDIYDAVTLWTNFRSDLDDALAYQIPVKNDVQGIGLSIVDRTRAWGSGGRLHSVILMGNLAQYPKDPRAPIYPKGANTLGLLAQEIGHRWLAFVRFRERGTTSQALLGRGKAHWSFFMDSSASFLEGNDLEEESPGRFRSVQISSRYSKLDLYLMGLASAAEVGPFFVVEDASGQDEFSRSFTSESAPYRGALVRGKRKNVLIDDIIAVEGPRVPDVDASPKSFRHAFILLSRPNRPPGAEELQKLEAVRSAWEGFFQSQTLGRATANATLE